VYKRISVQDSGEENIEDYFPEAVSFILTHIGPNQRVLVHCEEGQSRSPTIVIAWMMKHLNITLKEAYEKFLGIVGEDYVGINDGFKRQLMNWDVLLHDHKSIDFFSARSKNVTRKYSNTLLLENVSQSLPNLPSLKKEHDVPTSLLTSVQTSPKKRKERSISSKQFTKNKRQRLYDNTEFHHVIECATEERAHGAAERVNDAEKRESEVEKRAYEAEKRAVEAEKRVVEAEKRVCKAEIRASEAEKRVVEAEKRAVEAEKRVCKAEIRASEAEKRASEAEKRVVETENG